MAIDDDPVNLRVLGRIIERGGFTRYVASTDPRDALALIFEEQPDLIILDQHMPQMHGLAVLDLIRPVLENDNIPVLMISGDLSVDVRQSALAGGARDFVGKPYDYVEVVLRVRNLLETRLLYRELREQNQVLEVRVAERTAELERSHAEMLERLAEAAELRDDDTGEHTRRVGDLSARIAVRMGVRPNVAEMLCRAAALHDVGKIGVPDAILLKPGPLTPDERARMQLHATVGARLLAGSSSPLMQMAELVAASHHERWDGAGYPHGLSGHAIPLEARIVAAADFYDALSHARPYRGALPPHEVRRMVLEARGTHHDPLVSDALLAETGEQTTVPAAPGNRDAVPQ